MADVTPEARRRAEAAHAAPDGHVVTPELIRAVSEALRDGHLATARALVLRLHAADLADVLETLKSDERSGLMDALGTALDPEVFAEVDEQVRDDVIDQMAPEALAAAAAELASDDAAYVLEDLEVEEQQKVLEAMPAAERGRVAAALAFPETSAGRLMRRDFVAVPEYWNIGQVIDWLRENDALPDQFHEIFVVDPKHEPLGTVALSRAMRTKRPVAVSEVMTRDLHPVPQDMDQEEVAFLFDQYALLSAPVVDPDGRLVGQITVDDVVDVIQEEAEEDIHRLGGVSAEGDLHLSAAKTATKRFAWLFVNLVTAILASLTIGLFADTIEQVVALAVLMPIVASMGGNAGTQTMTVAVRALATRELSAANAARIVAKELLVGLYGGVVFAALGFAVALLWFDDALLGGVLAAAMVVNLFVATLSGVTIPLALDRAGIDPAISAAVLLTTVTDVLGFFAFLGLAKLILF